MTDSSIAIFEGSAPLADGNFLGHISGKAAKIIAECAINDEPLFVLRAQDIFSVMGIAGYHKLIEQFSPSDVGMEREIVEAIDEFKRWQANNRETVRYPD